MERWQGRGIYKATLQQALDDAWKGKFSVLIIWSLDRLTRGGAEDAVRVLRQFRQRGCTVVCVQEWWLHGSPEVQDVLVSFAGWVAQQGEQPQVGPYQGWPGCPQSRAGFALPPAGAKANGYHTRNRPSATPC